MSTNNKKDKELEQFLDRQINIISDFFEGEEQFDKNLKEKLNTTCQINILNKEWIEKWKQIVGYEEIKKNCRKCNNNKNNDNLKNELYDFLIKNNTKKKLEELGKMDFQNYKKDSNIENGNNILFNEVINFIPMSALYCSYLNKYIEDIKVSGSFVKGKCFLYNEFNNKDKNKKDKIKEKKVLILEKKIGNNNDEFNALMVTLGENEDIKKFINNVKNKTFEDLMSDKNLKAVKREISKNKVNKIIKNKNDNKIEEVNKKKKEDTDKNNKIEVKEKKGEADKNNKIEDKEKKGVIDNEKKEEIDKNKKVDKEKKVETDKNNKVEDKEEKEKDSNKNEKVEDKEKIGETDKNNKLEENKEEKVEDKKEKEKENNERKEKENNERKEKENKEKKEKENKEQKEKEKKEQKEKQNNERKEKENKEKKEKENKEQKEKENNERKEKENNEKKEKENNERKEKENNEKKEKEKENNERKEKEKEKENKAKKEKENKEQKEKENKKEKEKENKEKKVEEKNKNAEKNKKEIEENNRKELEQKNKELDEKKKREVEEKNRKDLEEKKKREEEEKKIKEEEKKKKELEGKKKKEEEEKKKKKELEEKMRKEFEEKKKKKEEEEKKKKEEEEEKKKKKEEEETKKKKEEEEKMKKEEENKKNIINTIFKGIQEIHKFDNEIAKNSSQKDKNFLSKCSIINKEWYKKLLEYSNFNIIKEQIKTNENIESTLKKNNDKINFNAIETLFQQNPNEIEIKPLDDIENLAFISTRFLENMNGFRKEKGNNININGNDKEITIKNGQALLEINNQFCCFDLQEGNINKPKNKEIFDIPESLNKNEFLKEIKEDKEKINLRDIAKKKLTPRITIEKDVSLGLDNVGATCYMNATLQCLAHIKKISDHIVNYKRNKKFTDAKKYRLTKAYAEVVNGIWFPEEGKRSFAPNEFKKVIGEMNSLFAPTAANDAKDLLIFLIEQMHNELNKTKETNLALIMPDNMDPTNQQQVFQCFAQEFTKKYNSVFSTYCYGSNTSMTLCHGCNIAKYSFQCFSFIIFPLLEAKNHRNYLISCGSLPQQLYNQPLNIEDCFNYYQKIEFFTGDNQMYCNYCRQLRNASMCTQIYYAPLVLILVLNRGRGNLDFREKFVFWETINLFNYVQFKMPDNTYFLSGIITHLGESGEGGHFIAFCRMSKDSKWYCYNDSIVNESNFNEINNKGTPYILFYQKIKME